MEIWDWGVGIYVSREYTNCGQYGFLDRDCTTDIKDCTLMLVGGVALGGGGGGHTVPYSMSNFSKEL
jgi:hypothetical protein